jgi:hypothetical protein
MTNGLLKVNPTAMMQDVLVGAYAMLKIVKLEKSVAWQQKLEWQLYRSM